MKSQFRNGARAAMSVELPNEATSHISADTVTRLKAACSTSTTERTSPVQAGSVLAAANHDEPFGMVCELESGTTGTVYLAIDRRSAGTGKFVAVKRLHARLTETPDFTESFVQELREAAAIDHPYVCRLLDFGLAGSSYYAATEFLQGEPIAKILSTAGVQRMDARTQRVAARVIANLAEGLHAIHSLRSEGKLVGALHGDISTRNVFVLFDGTVRISDLGLSWVRDAALIAEGSSARVDQSYFSPEQLAGGPLDARSDVWALGVVMWEMLVGQKLFHCDSAREAAVEISARRIAAPSELNPQIPSALDAIVLKALSRNRAKRYVSARELSLALAQFLASTGAPVHAGAIATWLGKLFPSGAEHDQELLSLANDMADRLPSFDDENAPAPPSHAYTRAANDEPEATTHIFVGALRNTLLSVKSLPAEEPLEVTSLRDMPVTRRARRFRKQHWSARVPYVVVGGIALVFGLGLSEVVIARMAMNKAQRAHQLGARPALAENAQVPRSLPAAPLTPAAPAAPSARVTPAAPTTQLASAALSAPIKAPAPTAKALPTAPLAGPAPKPAPAASVLAPTGSVFLSTPGGMEVSEQGRSLGRAPGEFELSVGTHTLLLKSATDTRTMTIHVSAGAAVVVSVPKANKPSP